MMRSSRLALYTSMIAFLAFGQTACLKTRAQIKGDQPSTDNADNSGGDDERKPATPTAHHSSGMDMEEIRTEMTRLSGKLEEVEHAQKVQNTQELKEYMTRLDARISDIEKNQLLVMTELKEIKDKKTAEAQEAATPAADFMTAGNQLLAQKKFEEAAEKFKSLLNKNIKGKEAAEAHFGLGEAEYGQKNYKKAIVQYSKVQESFAKSARIPTSLYKIGMSFGHLNMPKEAKGFFSELTERYPKSPEAKKARGKIGE